MKSLRVFAGAAALALAGTAIGGTAAAKTVTVGFTVSQTGQLNVDSINQLHGFEMWRDDVNKAGGIKVGSQRYKVKLVYYDDQSKAERVQQLYSRLILNDHAQFLFSPYSSGLTATAAVISEQYGKVMLTTGAAEDKTYTLGNTGLFQVYTPATHYLSSALRVIKDKDPKARMAIAYSDDGFSKAVATAAAAEAKTLGLDVVFDEAYAPSTTDFGPIINKIIAAKADVLVGGGHYADGATLARQLYDQKVPLRFISLLVAPDSDTFATLGAAADGITVPSQWEPSATYKPAFGPTGKAFADAYKARYHADAPYHAAGGYAAGLLLEHAIETAGSLNADKVRAALNATDATIFFGHIKFATDAGHHGLQVGHTMVLAQWQKAAGGHLVKQVVWPKAAQTAPLAYPIR
jgi:branched-chain amino acid transport system substrate-binding protein